MQLRVGIDKRPTEEGFKAHSGRGTGRYVSELCPLLVRLSSEFDTIIRPFGSPECAGNSFERGLLKALPFGKTTVESQLLFPRRIKRLDVDLVHYFAHGDAPAVATAKNIVTVLDLIPLKFPELYGGGVSGGWHASSPDAFSDQDVTSKKTNSWRFRLARALELRSIEQAQGLVAISECTKKDVIEILGVPEEKIVVTPLAVSSRFKPFGGDSLQRELQRRKLKKDFGLNPEGPVLLYVGGIDPRKNVLFLIKVFSELVARFKSMGSGSTGGAPQLVLAGRYENDKYFSALKASIRKYDVTEEVKLLGFVADERIVDLYNAADLTLFASLYEGFGLPVLESLACGTPVVAGDNSCISEVTASSGGVLLPDNDLERWVREIEDLVKAGDERERLRSEGLKRSKVFTWENTARKTLEAYQYFSGLSQ